MLDGLEPQAAVSCNYLILDTRNTAKPFNDRQVYTLPFTTITGEHLSKKKTDKELF